MAEKGQSFWDRLFSIHTYSDREEKVLEYIIHRLKEGTDLEDVVREEYVRRHASPDEVQDILDNARLVESIRKKMEEDFEELGEVHEVLAQPAHELVRRSMQEPESGEGLEYAARDLPGLTRDIRGGAYEGGELIYEDGHEEEEGERSDADQYHEGKQNSQPSRHQA